MHILYKLRNNTLWFKRVLLFTFDCKWLNSIAYNKFNLLQYVIKKQTNNKENTTQNKTQHNEDADATFSPRLEELQETSSPRVPRDAVKYYGILYFSEKISGIREWESESGDYKPDKSWYWIVWVQANVLHRNSGLFTG